MSNSNTPRIGWAQCQELAPDVIASFRGVQKAVNASGLDKGLVELVKVRASQINGCAFCLEMHTADALKAGVTSEKLHLVAVWDEAQSVFTDDELAALAWTEALTEIAGREISDELYERVKSRFGESKLVHLTAAIALINAWNRIAKPLGYALSGSLAK